MAAHRTGNKAAMSSQHDTAHGAAPDAKSTLATYVSDMLALERHIAAPIESQAKSGDHQSYAAAYELITRIKSTTDQHIQALEARLATLGGDGSSGIKTAWAQIIGGGAAAINAARSTKVSKSLRDDSTALSLEAISYTMLHATAMGLGDQETAALAKRHLDDVAPIIVSISREMPAIVLQELRGDGHQISVSASQITEEATRDSWSGGNTGQ